jgi:signal peptidase II
MSRDSMSSSEGQGVNPKAARFWPILLILFLTDCTTKQMAEERLTNAEPLSVLGDMLRFTLAYNPGAAFSISLGEYSRWSLTALTIVILAILLRLYRDARPADTPLVVGLGLLVGGALGNLVDRVRSPRGVVDFIDVGVGDSRFWIFNIADMGILFGALMLSVLVWKREGWLSPPLDARGDVASPVSPDGQPTAE